MRLTAPRVAAFVQRGIPAQTSVDGLHRPPLALTGLTAFEQVEEVLSSKEQMLLGMQMFQLTDIEVIHEPLTDTKVSPGCKLCYLLIGRGPLSPLGRENR